jgi:hypothetical protein
MTTPGPIICDLVTLEKVPVTWVTGSGLQTIEKAGETPKSLEEEKPARMRPSLPQLRFLSLR